MNASRYRLGIDFGTSTTVAMLGYPGGRVRPLLFDGSPLLSSAVFAATGGQLHTGGDGAHLARGNPERLEPNPKRRIDDGAVLLGADEIDVRDLIAAVLRRVVAEAVRVAGPYTVWVYDDEAAAKDALAADRTGPAAGGGDPAAEDGAGEEAFTHGRPVKAGREIQFVMAARQDNLRFIATMTANRLTADAWTATWLNQYWAAFVNSAHSSFGNVTG